MTPYELDVLARGVRVRIYERPDGTRYATHHDFGRFGVKPIDEFRVPLDQWKPEGCEAVEKRLAQLSR